MAFPVGGSRFANRHLSGNSFVEGKKFYRLVQMRSAVDNTNTRRARPPLICQKCDSRLPATLQHILCQCKDNERSIRRRHDRVLDEIISHCKQHKLRFTKEPSLHGGLRPDLTVILPNGELLCLDVSVVFELSKDSLTKACKLKNTKYSPYLPEIADQMGHNFTQNSCFSYGLVFGARGSVAPQTLNVLEKSLKMPKWRIDKIINLIITFSLDLFEHSPLCSRA